MNKSLNIFLQFRYVLIETVDKQMLAIELLKNFFPESRKKKN